VVWALVGKGEEEEEAAASSDLKKSVRKEMRLHRLGYGDAMAMQKRCRACLAA